MWRCFFVVFLSLIFVGQAQGEIVPENDLWIPVSSKAPESVSEKRFHSSLDRLQEIYNSVLEGSSLELQVHRDWSNGEVNAAALRSGNVLRVFMTGGLARHKDMTLDGLILIACHEIGHHLGGAPKSSRFPLYSAEGQSDYFGSMKCFRRFMQRDDNQRLIKNLNVPTEGEKECRENFSHPESQAMCQRSVVGGIVLSKVLSDLQGLDASDINLGTPSQKRVEQTDTSHPAPQCRLDTYFQAAICPVDYEKRLSDEDPTQGACARILGDDDGNRPRCWYKPAES